MDKATSVSEKKEKRKRDGSRSLTKLHNIWQDVAKVQQSLRGELDAMAHRKDRPRKIFGSAGLLSAICDIVSGSSSVTPDDLQFLKDEGWPVNLNKEKKKPLDPSEIQRKATGAHV